MRCQRGRTAALIRSAACAGLCAMLLHGPAATWAAQPAASPGTRPASQPAAPPGSRPAGRPAAPPGSQPAAASAASAAAPAGTAAPFGPLPLDQDKVLAHIRQTLDWYDQTHGVEQLPQLSSDVVSRDRLRQAALIAVRLAFDFGRAAVAPLAARSAGSGASAGGATAGTKARNASAAPAGAAAPAGSGAAVPSAQQGRSLDQVSTRIASRIQELDAQVKQLETRIAHASPRARKALRAQRDQARAALGLEREARRTVDELRRFQSSMLFARSSSSKDLMSQIIDLERSVPEAWRNDGSAEPRVPTGPPESQTDTGSAGGAAAVPPAGRGAAAGRATPSGATAAGGMSPGPSAATFRPESAGIITLIGQWIAIKSADGQIGNLLRSTGALRKELDGLRAPLVAQARTLVRLDMSGLASSDRAQLEASRRALDAAAERFRQLAALLVPLGDQQFALDSANGALTQWRSALRSRLATAARYLLTRIVILATLIAAVLVVSEVWRRAVFKYLHDSRRRSQFQTLRRVIVGIALAVVVVFALVSQLGSLATYVGFLTAGLAVALQNVILSIVAYFFLIGRYGVRVGDRITLAGVTGRVVDIGLIRIYLMELAGPDLRSTGRIVVLSNSVLFQPQALFKQIPGADYLWHSICLALAPTADVQAAQQLLQATADDVYQHYRPAIEAQHAAVRRIVDFETSAPCPEVRVRYAEQGWLFEVRYPVQADHAARIDQRMLEAVRDALARAPQMEVAASGEPVLKPQT